MSSDAPLDPAVLRFLASLDDVPWFRHVGDPITDADVARVASWEEAWEALQDESWTYASVHFEVDTGHPAWIAACDRVRARIEGSPEDHELADGVTVALQAAHDAGCAALELATGRRDGVFGRMMAWYRRGHWPCGWSGDFPDGTLIVF